MEDPSNPLVEKIEFKGTTKEWFGIWIVNLLLSIVTLGIYSPWAKVRRKKYFYNNTYIGGRNFDYHATGRQIFIGRLFVFGLLFGIAQINNGKILGVVIALVFYLIIPWFILRSIIFNARMSSWSNIRFNFKGIAWNAYLVFYLYPFLALLTLYLAFPFQYRALKKFLFNNYFLGTSRFSMKCSIEPFYWALGVCMIWFSLFGVFFSFVGYLMNNYLFVVYLIMIVGIPTTGFLYKVMVHNAVYSSLSIGNKVRFCSTIVEPELMWIIISNMIVIICSLGLMLPWTKIRLTKYLAKHTKVIFDKSLDDFVGTQTDKIDTLGEAYTDIEGIEGIDVGF